MKKSALGFAILFISTSFLVSCSDSKTVNLRDSKTPPPIDDGGGQTKPEPTPEVPDEGDGGSEAVPTPAVDKVARIFCESQPHDARSFNTLRSDVYSNYWMPTIDVYVGGKKVFKVKSPFPLQSNGEEAFLILRAQEDAFTPWRIYKTTLDLDSSRGDLQAISNFEEPSKSAQFVYNYLELENRILTANLKRSAYVYPSDNGTYVWKSLNKGTKFSLPFTATSSYSPEFVGDDDYLRFDQLTSGGSALTQRFYHFDTKKTLSLPAATDSKDSQLFGYINAQKNTIYWVEGHPEGTWKLRSIGIGPGAKAITLTTLPGNPSSIVLPMVILDSQGEIVVAYNEEELSRDRNAQLYFKTASLHVVKVIGTQTVPYPDELKKLVKMDADFHQGLLRSLFLEPISGKLFASNIPKGGLVSFDLKKSSWETHAMIANILGCLNPQWGVEVPHE